jgi:hypothetical protein
MNFILKQKYSDGNTPIRPDMASYDFTSHNKIASYNLTQSLLVRDVLWSEEIVNAVSLIDTVRYRNWPRRLVLYICTYASWAADSATPTERAARLFSLSASLLLCFSDRLPPFSP